MTLETIAPMALAAALSSGVTILALKLLGWQEPGACAARPRCPHCGNRCKPVEILPVDKPFATPPQWYCDSLECTAFRTDSAPRYFRSLDTPKPPAEPEL